jgi:hypothetical protein
VAIGFTASLLVGALFLAWRAVTLSHPSCDGLLAEECALEQEIASNLFRLHAGAAAGLLLVFVGLALTLRRTSR